MSLLILNSNHAGILIKDKIGRGYRKESIKQGDITSKRGKCHYSIVVKPLCSGQEVCGSNPACTRLRPIFPHKKQKKPQESCFPFHPSSSCCMISISNLQSLLHPSTDNFFFLIEEIIFLLPLMTTQRLVLP